MKIYFWLTGLFFLGFCKLVVSQDRITVEEYIEMYKDLAIEEMNKNHIPASITLAQGLLESNTGNSPLAQEANNHFGIKCHKEWTGKTFYQDDDEKNECFRKYAKAEDSYRDHSQFLRTRDRYKSLFDLEETDYRGWAYGLKAAGYATNPKYPELLIKIIEENKLYTFDTGDGRKSLANKEEPTQNSKLKTQTQNSNTQTHNSNTQTHNSKLKTQNSRKAGPPDNFDLVGKGGNDRIIFSNNGVKFIYAREGDNFQLIASEFEIYSWQVYTYNELKIDDQLIVGQKVYLEKKKGRAAFDYHIVKNGDSLQSISQDYGIRLKSLCKINGFEGHETLEAGLEMRLR